MRKQVLYEIISINLEESNLKAVEFPFYETNYIVIYDSKVKSILDIIKNIYKTNAFGEKDIMDKICDEELVNSILNSKTFIPAIAFVDTETLDLEVEMVKEFSTSKYFSMFQDVLLFLGEWLTLLEAKKYELQDEYNRLNDMREKIETAVYPVLGLISVYKENLKNTPFYKFSERKKWKNAIENISDYRESKIHIVQKELGNLKRKIEINMKLQDKCEREYLCLLKCREYLSHYICGLRVNYLERLSNIKEEIGA